jgi:hypothetical protein
MYREEDPSACYHYSGRVIEKGKKQNNSLNIV